MNKTTEEEILQELRCISKLLSLTVTRDLSQKEKIELLSGIGFQPKEIADLIGTTPGSVSVTLTAIRKKAKAERGGTRRRPKESKSDDKQATSKGAAQET